jgi:DNA-binding NtrC family response regulator
LRRFSQETNKPIEKISRDAMDEIMLYDWPGNVRELENAIERAVVVCKGPQISAGDLPIFCAEEIPAAAGSSLAEIEKTHIEQVLKENAWNVSRSAKILGIDRTTLYSKIKRYQIQK